MADGHKVVKMMQHLVELISSNCTDQATLDELDALLSSSQESWGLARDLFQRIRQKTLVVYRQNNQCSIAQYHFEEVCAKTLYNLSGLPAPYDADSISKILPSALAFCSYIGISEAQIIRVASV
jgi:hypothetical protein